MEILVIGLDLTKSDTSDGLHKEMQQPENSEWDVLSLTGAIAPRIPMSKILPNGYSGRPELNQLIVVLRSKTAD